MLVLFIKYKCSQMKVEKMSGASRNLAVVSDLYSGWSQFGSWPGYLLSWQVFSRFPQVPRCECRCRTLEYVTSASFRIPSNLLCINYPDIRR
jgi:hypothetical protein